LAIVSFCLTFVRPISFPVQGTGTPKKGSLGEDSHPEISHPEILQPEIYALSRRLGEDSHHETSALSRRAG